MGHHFVPQHYLRGFAVDNAIWAYDRKLKKKFPTQVKSVANENDLYTDELENRLERTVEAPANLVLDKIREREPISEEQKRQLAHYLVVLWKRGPKGRERVFARIPETVAEIRAKLMAEVDAARPTHPETILKVETYKNKLNQVLDQHLIKPLPGIWHHTIESGTKLIESMIDMNWLYLTSGRNQFLTSDNPVFFFEHEGVARLQSEISFPISHDIALFATRQKCQSGSFLEASKACRMEINRRTAHNSVRFVYSMRDEPWVLPFAIKSARQLSRIRIVQAQ